MTSFSPVTLADLRLAGWTEDRAIREQVDRWDADLTHLVGRPMPPAARLALMNFGGLDVGSGGPGVDHARGSLQFDPALAAGVTGEIAASIGKPVYPLGEADHGHGTLAITDDGEVWSDGIDGSLRLLGYTIEEAIERTLTGLADIAVLPQER